MKKQEIRKGFEWYRMLTKKQQKRFRLECHKFRIGIGYNGYKWFEYVLNKETDGVTFITGSFAYGNSIFGTDYWIKIMDKY